MTTVHLTVNTRKTYGDEAKETSVGIYEIENISEFKVAVENASLELNKNPWIAPIDRPRIFREKLEACGFSSISVETIFAPIF